MDDSSWKKLLEYIFKIEAKCHEVAPWYDIMYIRINLPAIAGLAKDPLISYQMMDKVAKLIQTPNSQLQ